LGPIHSIITMLSRNRIHLTAAIAALFVCVGPLVESFVLPNGQSFAPRTTSSQQQKEQPTFVLSAAGMGMGMGSPTKNKKKNKKGSKKNKSSSGGGRGDAAPFNANASLMRMEKVYDEMAKADAKAMQNNSSENYQGDDKVMSEYIIAARAPTVKDAKAASDWVPVAQMAMVRPYAVARASEAVSSDDNIKAVVSQYCREIGQSAMLGAPVFKSIPRNAIEYSVESTESFYKHVYDVVIEGKNEDANNDQVMTKAEARKVLELDANDVDANDVSAIKRSYRKLSMKLHPDRFVGVERTEEEIKASSDQFAQVKLAYETMSSGVRSADGKGMSWYESLGGRERTEFYGPIPLMARDLSKTIMDRHQVQSAIVGLDPELVHSFVARNQAVKA